MQEQCQILFIDCQKRENALFPSYLNYLANHFTAFKNEIGVQFAILPIALIPTCSNMQENLTKKRTLPPSSVLHSSLRLIRPSLDGRNPFRFAVALAYQRSYIDAETAGRFFQRTAFFHGLFDDLFFYRLHQVFQ